MLASSHPHPQADPLLQTLEGLVAQLSDPDLTVADSADVRDRLMNLLAAVDNPPAPLTLSPVEARTPSPSRPCCRLGRCVA